MAPSIIGPKTQIESWVILVTACIDGRLEEDENRDPIELRDGAKLPVCKDVVCWCEAFVDETRMQGGP